MKNTIYFTTFALVTLGIMYFTSSCVKDRQFSNIPEIEFKKFNKTTLLQGSQNQDTIRLTIGFRDGDGDIGNNQQVALTIKDTRLDNAVPLQYVVPELPELGAQQGLEGTMDINLYSVCCFQGSIACQPFDNMPTQELIFSIQLTDNAGNESNIILTDPIQLLCN